MLAVVASALDEEAAAIVERWRRHEAVLVTPPDLSHPGWEVEVSGNIGTFVAGGRRFPAADLAGVLTRLANVPPYEMVGVVPADRPYAACESTAMLSWWLEQLPCLVVNRPSPTCLTGPRRSQHEWMAHAAALGVNVVPSTVEALRSEAFASRPVPEDNKAILVIAVAGRTTSGPEDARRSTEILAAEADVALLGAWFRPAAARWALCAVTLVPPLGDESLEALEDTLL
jgi:hypothetical protein